MRCREADEAEHGAEKITVASKNSEKVHKLNEISYYKVMFPVGNKSTLAEGLLCTYAQ